MPPHNDSISSIIGYLGLQKVLFLLYAIPCVTLFAVAFALFGPVPDVDWIRVPIGLIALGAFFFIYALSRKAAELAIYYRMTIQDATIAGFLYYITILQFLPFADSLQRWSKKKYYKNPYTQDQSPNDTAKT